VLERVDHLAVQTLVYNQHQYLPAYLYCLVAAEIFYFYFYYFANLTHVATSNYAGTIWIWLVHVTRDRPITLRATPPMRNNKTRWNTINNGQRRIDKWWDTLIYATWRKRNDYDFDVLYVVIAYGRAVVVGVECDRHGVANLIDVLTDWRRSVDLRDKEVTRSTRWLFSTVSVLCV